MFLTLLYTAVLFILCEPIFATYPFFDAELDVYFDFYSSATNLVGSAKDRRKVRFNDAGEIDIPDNYDVHKQTFMYIHGYLSTPRAQTKHVKYFFENIETGKHCCNFIVLKWTNGNLNLLYNLMMERSRNVANIGFRLIRELRIKKGLVLENFTMVGHSIGAHIAAMISRDFLNLKLRFIKRRRRMETEEFIDAGSTELKKYATRLRAMANERKFKSEIRAAHMAKELDEIVARLRAVSTSEGLEWTHEELIRQSIAEQEEGNKFYHADIEWAPMVEEEVMDYGLCGNILGVDPAGPSYREMKHDRLDRRIRPGLAIYTMIIHTNAGTYGLEQLLGDSDFYPDGGMYQPCCSMSEVRVIRLIAICSHKSAARMYWGSLKLNTFYKAIRCDNRESIMNFKFCEQMNDDEVYELVNMGTNLVYVPHDKRPRGIFYTETTGKDYDNIEPIGYSPVVEWMAVLHPIINHVSSDALPNFSRVCFKRSSGERCGSNWVPLTVKEREKMEAQRKEMADQFRRMEECTLKEANEIFRDDENDEESTGAALHNTVASIRRILRPRRLSTIPGT